jgi:phosphatidylinositol alpha-1,6-mannosyltransferase
LLVVTNDFPPRVGGIEDYVSQVLAHLPGTTEATVLAPAQEQDAAFDAGCRHRVVRWPVWPMLPTPGLARAVVDLVERERPDVLLFGAALPLALMAGRVRSRVPVPVVAFTHGVEPSLARLPGVAAGLRAIARRASALTAVSAWAEGALRRAVGPAVRIRQLPSGVDPARFRPDVSGAAVRAALGLGDAPVVACVSRLVRRKGVDQLIRALPGVRRACPGARLLVVGDGLDRARLERLARRCGVASHVVFTGRVPHDAVPAHFAAGDVFAMPCRSRLASLENEGLGAVYLQAAAVARPVIAGRSGGAPEAVEDGRTGLVVDGRSLAAVEAAVCRLLRCRDEARAMGLAGAERVHRTMTWAHMGARLDGLLREVTSGR